jgi:perosamine synthetase
MGSERRSSLAAVIPLSVPEVTGHEWTYVKECLDTGWVSSAGPFVDRFECELARRVDAAHAVATVNGTAALHVALLVAGVSPGDDVIVPSLTFIAPANAVRYAGAWPVFLDAEPRFWQLDPNRLADFVAKECRWHDGALINMATGRRLRAVLPVDLLGHPADIDAIREVASSRDLTVIEDATESLGARYKDRPVGSRADAVCFSFNGNKIVTSGGGGMIVTGRGDWAARARYLTTQAKDDPIEYVHREVGFNYRLTNVEAAIGLAQLERLDEYVERKRRLAANYRRALASVPGLTCPEEASWARSTFWLYTVLVDGSAFGTGSRDLMRRLADAGIQSRPLWQPGHRSPAHRESVSPPNPIADDLHARALSLPSSVGLTPVDQQRVIDAVLSIHALGR